ncbi:MAG: diguanylate cyclase [Acidobacteriia bacterium]|nr:diguanylate cyclase [Terriglobia bacterium]
MRPLSLRRRILIGFAAPLAVVVVTWGVLYDSLVTSVTATRSVARTDQVLTETTALVQAVMDAESGKRGYLLTGERSFLDEYRRGMGAFGPAAARLEQLVQDSPEQHRRVRTMEALFEKWRSEIASPEIDARRSNPPRLSDASQEAYAGVLDLLRGLPGHGRGSPPSPSTARRKIDEIRRSVTAAAAEEVDPGDRAKWRQALEFLDEYRQGVDAGRSAPGLLEEAEAVLRDEADANRIADAQLRQRVATREGAPITSELLSVASEFQRVERASIETLVRGASSGIRVGRTVALVGPVVALALALWGMLTSSVGIARSVEAIGRAAQGLARGDLGHRVPVERDDEVGRLAGAFNTMADRLERRSFEQALLREMGDLLHSCRTLGEAFEVAPGLVKRLFPGGGAISRLSPDRTVLEPAVTWGNASGAAGGVPLFTPEECWALRRGRTHVSRSEGSAPACAHPPRGCGGAMICIPLTAQGETLGILTLCGGDHDADLGRESGPDSPLGLAEIVAERLALAIANLRLQETLRDQSVRDPLTGLFNRRYMEETLQRELYRASRRGVDLSLVMLDVDHFKTTNDRYGHEAGDALLRELGGWLASQLRQGDVACRYGGEEFVLILPGASLDAGRARAERLREAVKVLRVRHRGVLLDPFTLSLGVAVHPQHGSSGDELLRAADAALYRAKAEGRDRVIAAV